MVKPIDKQQESTRQSKGLSNVKQIDNSKSFCFEYNVHTGELIISGMDTYKEYKIDFEGSIL